MSDTRLQAILTDCLPSAILKRHGQILYSGTDTLRAGSFYFLGFNPAADGTNPPLHDLPLNRKHWSAYTRQCWYDEWCDARCPKIGKRPHQRRVQSIMSELGLQPEETFATNLIFIESRNVKELNAAPLFHTYLEACWQVHKRMLAVVDPRYIVCLGNGEKDSSFSFVREKAESRENEARYLNFKSFDGVFHLNDGISLSAKVIGVRHPSRPMSAIGLRHFIGC
jgi:hypothetical protein